jgi:carbamoyl-phosphate synthase large subunit
MGSNEQLHSRAAEELLRRLGRRHAGRPAIRWTQDDVARLLERVQPTPTGRPGDQSRERSQLAAAFLAGVAQAHEEAHGLPTASYAGFAAQTARTLLKNRAATQPDRALHAFLVGLRMGSGGAASPAADADAGNGLRLFVRQPFTESGQTQQALVASVLERIRAHDGHPAPFHYLTGCRAESADTFRTAFEDETGRPFSPEAFRAHRLRQLDQADVFVNIRAGMSESSAFELSYHVFRGACTPILFLVWKQAPIKTTLLKDLGSLCDVTYLEFDDPAELDAPLAAFFRSCERGRRSARPVLARAGA